MQSGATRILLLLTGMRNNSCREQIEDVLRQVKGVKEVNVSLIRARAIVECSPPCTTADLIQAVSMVGYGAAVSSR